MKQVGPALYVHATALDQLPPRALQAVEEARALVPEGWQVVRADRRAGRYLSVMFGWTTDWDEPHPKLLSSILVRQGEPGSRRSYHDTPIYHRKETMLPDDHPRRQVYARLTAQEEAAGLLGRKDLGRQSAWDRELANRGLRIEDHRLIG